jgi:regulator of RNase E activity RraA
MSTRAKYLGAQGVVIDGHFRDINEHVELGFPVSRCCDVRSKPRYSPT